MFFNFEFLKRQAARVVRGSGRNSIEPARSSRFSQPWALRRNPVGILMGLVVVFSAVASLHAQTILDRTFTNLNLTIPDNDPSGAVNVQTISGSPRGSVVLDVKVSVKLAGLAARNGDLYAALEHSTGFSILLNRVGRSTNNLPGYADAGLEVLFDDGAANGDIHFYRAVLFGNHETPVGQGLSSLWAGAWAPDGRYIDPADALDSSARQATLSSMKGLPVDGRWRLFVADVAPGGVSQLREWSLQIVTTTNLNALQLEFEDATFRAESEARRLDAPITVKGHLAVAGGADTTLAGAVSGTGTLVKTGDGKLVLSGVNTFSGGIVLEEGTLVLDGDRGIGLGPLKLKGGRIESSGGSKRFDNAVSLAGQLSFGGSGTLELGGSITFDASSELTVETDTVLSGDVEESLPGAGFIKKGNGKLTLSGVNSFSGGISLDEGTLVLGGDQAAGSGKITLKSGTKIETTGGARRLSNNFSLAGTVGISGGLTITGDVSLSDLAQLEVEGTTTLAGKLTEEKPGTGFAKKGNGTLVLEGANTISGGVSLADGTLLINNTSGSGTGRGSVSVTGKGTLGGKGTIAGNVTLGPGTQIAPGASPGMLTTGSQTWEAGAALVWEINDAAGTEGANPGWDTLKINGTLQLNATPANPILIRLASLTLSNAPGTTAHFDTTLDYAWNLAQTTGGVAGFDASALIIDPSGFANALNGGKLRVEVRGNDLVLAFQGVKPLRVTKTELVGNAVRLSIQGVGGQRYRVETADDLAAAAWVFVSELQANATGDGVFDVLIEPNRPARFFRLVSLNSP